MVSRKLHVHKTADELGAAVCEVIVAASQAAVASRGIFTVAFSGGSLPKIVAKPLLQCQDRVDFSKVT
jgi:6-phosphogluconolactonase/glucosamine-6-phosphate isomerase/deaminase